MMTRQVNRQKWRIRLTYARLAYPLINRNKLSGVHMNISLSSFRNQTYQYLLSFSKGDFPHLMKSVFKTWFLGHVYNGVHLDGFIPRANFYRNGLPSVGVRLVSDTSVKLSSFGGFQSKSGATCWIACVLIAELEIWLKSLSPYPFSCEDSLAVVDDSGEFFRVQPIGCSVSSGKLHRIICNDNLIIYGWTECLSG